MQGVELYNTVEPEIRKLFETMQKGERNEQRIKPL